MSRTYKDAPYWVKLKRNAIDKNLRKEIKPGLIKDETIAITPNKVYSYDRFYGKRGAEIRAIISKKKTTLLYNHEETIPGTQQEGLTTQYHYDDLPVLELRDKIAKIFNLATNEKTSRHTFAFIKNKLTTREQQAFVLDGTKTLIILSLNRFYTHFFTTEGEDEKQTTSEVKLNIKVYQVNDFNENYEILINKKQVFESDNKEFAFDPTIDACSCYSCNWDEQDHKHYKQKLPRRGGKNELRKRLNNYKNAYNTPTTHKEKAEKEENYTLLEDKI